MNNDESWDEFQKEIDNTLNEIENDQKEFFFELYDDIKAAGDYFLKGNKNESAICLAYEALIYFIVHEEFEKCAYLRSRLTEYSNSRSPWLNNYLESLIKI
jgi:hypothetical protein